MYFTCDVGNPQVMCDAGSQQMATPINGVTGCCGTGNVSFSTQACLGAAQGDSGTVYLRVAAEGAQACVDYALAYRFY